MIKLEKLLQEVYVKILPKKDITKELIFILDKTIELQQKEE